MLSLTCILGMNVPDFDASDAEIAAPGAALM
jgi:hypothetical protein